LPLEAEITTVLSEISPDIFCVYSEQVCIRILHRYQFPWPNKKVSLSFYTAYKGHFTITIPATVTKFQNTVCPPNECYNHYMDIFSI